VTNGHLDDVDIDKVREWEAGFQEYMAATHPKVGEEIRTKKVLSDELTKSLGAAIGQYKALRK
jgi:F-type H+-transporting ATPase subunit alpha